MITAATTVWLCIGAAFGVALPVVALLYWRKTRGAKLPPFFVGALTFVVFAGVLESLLHQVCVFGDNPVARAINGNPYLYMLYGGLAAGVFEETGRYVAFRRILSKKRFPERDTSVTYGIGHGGVESILTLGAVYGTYAVFAMQLNAGNEAAALALAGGSATDLAETMALLGQFTPGLVLLAMLERAGALILHISLSCFVFLAARDKRQWTWFPFAVALHAVVDMPAALYQKGMLPMWSVELWLWVVALYALRSARKCYLEMMDP